MTPRSQSHERRDIEARLALLHLSGMGPARSRWLLSTTGAEEVVARLGAGRTPVDLDQAPPGVRSEDLAKWSAEVAKIDPPALYQAQIDEGWAVLSPHDDSWPFADDPEPPLLLFCAGDVDLLSGGPAVGIVGTRRCTTVGRSVAHRMGFDLARAGVRVLSGLALGIDAAAHKGALDAGGAVVGVVGTGLDVVYPKRNRSLWAEVASLGLLVSEYPAGTQPERWRFPARNRLIAALSSGVVIVESHQRGGSLLTADEAVDRGKAVLSVPGSVVSPAADGTNGLIVDGASPVRHADDVLDALGLELQHVAGPVGAADGGTLAVGGVALPDLVRREVRAGPTTIDDLILASGRTPADVLDAVARLEAAGEVRLEASRVVWIG